MAPNCDVLENEKLMLDWDWEENEKHQIDPKNITRGSRKRVYWRCHICGGQWNTVMKERRGCPYCSGFKTLKGFNDLQTTDPEIASTWVYEKNLPYTPENVTRGSQKKMFWKCSKGHVFDMDIRSRVKGEGCPYCNNKRVLKGFNDLQTLRPEIAAEWDQNKNGELTPSDIVASTKKKYWWICSKGHEYEASVAHRCQGTGCPICGHKVVLKHYNDLATEFPDLALEWDYSKNNSLPSDFAPFSREKVWWICPKGHSFKAAIGDRSKGTKCPICQRERLVSYSEKTICFYVKKFFQVEENYRAEWLKRFELDMFLPEYNIGIEYDGVYGHSEDHKEKDLRKNRACLDHNVTLLRVREKGCPELLDSSIDYMMKDRDDLPSATVFVISKLAQLTKREISFELSDFSLDRDSGEIYSLVDYSQKQNSLLVKKPEIAVLWHPTKNGTLKPESVAYFSSKVVWWKGKCGHEWRSSVAYEASSGKCPFCSGKRILIGFNDLLSQNPKVAAQWNYKKNEKLRPEQFTTGSGKAVWWICSKGHSWKASIVSRTRNNHPTGCPICANKVVLAGYNDVASYPELLKDWDHSKNKISPEETCIGSERKVWWKCSVCGNEWRTAPLDRSRGTGCPKCAHKIGRQHANITMVKARGSLADKKPQLMKEWDWNKNLQIDPNNILPGSEKKAWWKCSGCGHKWQASIASRVRGRGCPKCAEKDRSIKRQENLLNKKPAIAVSRPDLARLWDNSKNDISADKITEGSGRRVWWVCPHCGKSFDAVVIDMAKGKRVCPFCFKKPL